MTDDRLWYAAYGSNTRRARFDLYLNGGTNPVTGRVTPGCRDPRPPGPGPVVELSCRLLFARRSTGWNGPVAFLDPDAPGLTYARLWQVSREQFADIVAQENVVAPGALPTEPMHALGRDTPSTVIIAGGWYGRLVHLGDRGGLPILTCTADWDLAAELPQPPTDAYLGTVAGGLVEAGLAPEEVARYLLAVPGVASFWDATSLAALVASVGG